MFLISVIFFEMRKISPFEKPVKIKNLLLFKEIINNFLKKFGISIESFFSFENFFESNENCSIKLIFFYLLNYFLYLK